MKYYLDTEFIEGFHKPLFGKKRHYIDLISIALVCEDGSEFYAISSDYNYNYADKWVKENVIMPIYMKTVHGDSRNQFDVSNFHKHFGKPNSEIAQSIFEFCTGDTLTLEKAKHYSVDYSNRDISFYAYYADYDWVVFCSLFGRMIDLPKGFPMYCKDLKQILDDYVWKYKKDIDDRGGSSLPFDLALDSIKAKDSYPKHQNEHSALDDAKWNKKLHEFLNIVM